MTYVPMLAPGMGDLDTRGMNIFTYPNLPMPCHDCLITGYMPNLVFRDGTVANANT